MTTNRKSKLSLKEKEKIWLQQSSVYSIFYLNTTWKILSEQDRDEMNNEILYQTVCSLYTVYQIYIIQPFLWKVYISVCACVSCNKSLWETLTLNKVHYLSREMTAMFSLLFLWNHTLWPNNINPLGKYPQASHWSRLFIWQECNWTVVKKCLYHKRLFFFKVLVPSPSISLSTLLFVCFSET